MESERVDRIEIEGRELEFVRIPARRRDAPTLVFLHEGLGSIALWRGFPEALAERTGCPALLYSRYGNGFSQALAAARAPSYMHEEALGALPTLLGALGCDDTVLVGHSDGASIATIYAAEHPRTVRGLVLEAPHLFVEELSVRSIAAIRERYDENGLRVRMSRYHADVDRTFYGWNDIWLAAEFRDWNIEPYARGLRAPVLAIQGLDDQYGTIAQIDALRLDAAGPVDTLVLSDCGHAPHRDRAAVVEAAMAGWIEEHVGA